MFLPTRTLLFPEGSLPLNLRWEATFRRCVEPAEMGSGGKDGQRTKYNRNISLQTFDIASCF